MIFTHERLKKKKIGRLKLEEVFIEKTLVIIKPDGVRRQLIGKILQHFEQKNLRILDLKMGVLTKEQLEEHYQHLKERPFFPELLAYMLSGQVVIGILEGEDAVDSVRKIVGATNPLEAQSGTIRALYGTSQTENVIHASDSVTSAADEIQRFLK